MDFSLEMNKGLQGVWNRIMELRKYLRVEGMTGKYEVSFLQHSGGLDDQDWDWVEDTQLICELFNTFKR